MHPMPMFTSCYGSPLVPIKCVVYHLLTLQIVELFTGTNVLNYRIVEF